MDMASVRRPSVARVVLGLFVVWQIIFLFGSNLLGLVPHGQPEQDELSDSRNDVPPSGSDGTVQKTIDLAADGMDRWAQWTGQIQAWWLFAPTFPLQATFPVVELRWDCEDASAAQPGQLLPPVRLRSVLEPDDPQSYFRPPGSFERFFHYEVRLGLLYTVLNKDLIDQRPDDCRKAVAQRVRRQWKSMRAYLRWRSTQFQREHPELPPPRQAILLVRIYRTPESTRKPWTWDEAVEIPFVRWQLDRPCRPGQLPLEMCDPVSGLFMGISANE